MSDTAARDAIKQSGACSYWWFRPERCGCCYQCTAAHPERAAIPGDEVQAVARRIRALAEQFYIAGQTGYSETLIHWANVLDAAPPTGATGDAALRDAAVQDCCCPTLTPEIEAVAFSAFDNWTPHPHGPDRRGRLRAALRAALASSPAPAPRDAAIWEQAARVCDAKQAEYRAESMYVHAAAALACAEAIRHASGGAPEAERRPEEAP